MKTFPSLGVVAELSLFNTTAKMVPEDPSVMVMRVIIHINSGDILHTFHLYKTRL